MTTKRFFPPDELTAIRAHCHWRRLLADLGVRADVRRCTDTEFWGFSPFNPNEKTASFHMKEPGIWYDWSTHATAPGRSRPGGGVIELVQAVHAASGQAMKLNEAAGWLVDRGYCRLDGAVEVVPPLSTVIDAGGGEEKANRPITLDLMPRLTELGTHPAFVLRGVSESTCRYLRCGYLDTRRGTLAGRIVFQVGGLSGDMQSRVILSHIGRATTPEQEADGKWRFYRGFNPSLELYNLDNLLLDETAAEQARASGTILLVEGAFDVAKLVEAGIRNVVATLGAYLSAQQAEKLVDALTRVSASRVIVFYDRDQAGQSAAIDAVTMLTGRGIAASSFEWEQQFQSSGRSRVPIPDAIQDPCDLSVTQLRWLHHKILT